MIRTPRTIDIAITTRCNLQCKYCFHRTSPGDVENDLPLSEWLKFFDELGQNGVMRVCLSGGEAFLRSDLKQMILAIVNNQMRYSILSNGAFITDEMANFIFTTKRCDHVQISIDGSKPEVHDLSRGKGSFVLAIRGLKILKKHKVPIAVRVTINRHNLKNLEEVAQFLLEDLELNSFSTNSAGYLGLCRKNADEMLLTTDERSEALKVMLKLSKKYPNRIHAAAGPLAEAKMWREMIEAAKEKKPPYEKGGYLSACGCSQSSLAVRADGVIVPCNMMSHIELGRMNQDSLKEIWQHSELLNQFRNRSSISLKDFEFCRECSYIDYCTGNCPAIAASMENKENYPNMESCLKKFLSEGGQVPEASSC